MAETNGTCRTCNAHFEQSAGRGRPAVYCSTACRAEGRKNAPRDSITKRCDQADCDRPLRARGMCSMHYRRWERANGLVQSPSSAWGPRRQANWKKRHAIKRGAPVAETIYVASIFDRDGWTCRLCGKPVDRTLAWPDPMSASLDHRTPVASGGTHTRDNVQLAHFRCNASKGSRTPVRLSLEA